MREKVALGELCNPSLGQVKEQPDTLIDYIDISSVDNESKSITGFQTMSFAEAPSRARKNIKKNNILVSTVRPNLNAVAVYEEETPNKTVASTGFCVLDCKDNVDYRFVFNFCKSQAFIEDMVSQATGASYPAVSDKIVRSSMIPAYSYEEQCQISCILDTVSKIIADRKKELQKLDELIKARFVELFGNPVTNDKGWDTDSCKNLMSKIGSGATPKGGRESYCEEGISLIRSMNVYNNRFEYKDLAHITEEQAKQLDNVTIEEDDILLNITGASVARCCVVPCDLLPARVNQHVSIIRCKERVMPDFVCCMFTEDNYQRLLWNIATAGGATREAITKQQLEELTLIVPPIDLQKQFIEFVKQVDKSKFEVKQSLNEMQILMDSLMQKYFG